MLKLQMAGRLSYYVSNRAEGFDEEDVWAVVKEKKDSKVRKPKESSPASTLRRLPTASRMIPRVNKASFNETKIQQQSAPVNIPDWSHIYRKNPEKGSYGRSCADAADEDDVHHDHDNQDDDEEEEEWIPPHEWIAKKLARTQISSFSVCEGAGRTLKGRDLSKVRNAVLSRTGFLE